MALLNTPLTTTAASVIGSNATVSNAVTVMYLCNRTTDPQYVNVFAVANGLTADDSTLIYANLLLTSQNTHIVDAERLLLAGGDAIYANCGNANAVVATISYTGM